MPEQPPFLACDLGGTKIKVAAVDSGTVVARTCLPADSAAGLEQRLPELAEALRAVAAEAGTAATACSGLSLAMPGIVDIAAGRVTRINDKYLDAPGLDLVGWAHDELGLPAVLENDARAAAIGEWQWGAGLDCDDIVMVTLGTGIGVAAVSGGRILRGPHGGAGIVGGHTTSVLNGRSCNCGMTGCAEAEASTSSLTALANEHPGFSESRLATAGPLDYEIVFGLARQGDEVARHLRDRSLQVWGALVVDLVHLFDPLRVIVGGGVARAPEVVPALSTAVADDPWSGDWGIDLVGSALGDDAALVAGSWLLDQGGTP